MNNFTYSIPTTVFFGKGQVENLPGAIKQYGNSQTSVALKTYFDAKDIPIPGEK